MSHFRNEDRKIRVDQICVFALIHKVREGLFKKTRTHTEDASPPVSSSSSIMSSSSL